MSGEEQLRERIATLYGSINSYDGRPTDSQLSETESVAADLAKKTAQFEALTKALADVNRTLTSRKLDPLTLLTREEWEKKDGGSAGGMTKSEMRVMSGRIFTW